MSPSRQSATVTFDWYNRAISFPSVDGFQESPLFGTECTKFYLRIKSVPSVGFIEDTYTLQLHLAFSKEATVSICGFRSLRFNMSPIVTIYGLSKNNLKEHFGGDVSLDKRKVLSIHFADNRYRVLDSVGTLEFTFEEITGEHAHLLSRQLADSGLDLNFSAHSATDLILITTKDKAKFPVHRRVLSARSPVFEAMLRSEQFRESQKGRIEIPDIPRKAMKVFLEYIYTAKLEKLAENAVSLLVLADKYDLPLLVQACVLYLVNTLSIKNASQFFYLASLYGQENWKRQVTLFIVQNRRKVKKTRGWRKYIEKEAFKEAVKMLKIDSF